MKKAKFKYNKSEFIIFKLTLLITSILLIFNVFNEDKLHSWISLLIFTILFSFSFLYHNTKKIFIFLLYLYQYMFIFSCFVKADSFQIVNLVTDIFPYFILPFLCYLILLPSIFMDIPKNLNIINNKYTDAFIYMLFPFILLSIIYLLPYTFDTFQNGAQSVRSEGQDNLPKSMLTTLGVGISIMYPLYMFLFYYAIANKKNKIILFITILGIICGIVGGLVFATRDRFIYILFYAILFNWIWKPYLINSLLYFKIKKYLWVFLFLIISLFIWITVDRFTSDLNNIFSWTLFYYGAQPYIFAEVIDKHTDFYGLSYLFPIFFDGNISFYQKDSYFWLWGTLFQKIYISGGWLYCICSMLIILILSSMVFRLLKNYVWIYCTYLILFYQVVAHGVFYYNLGFPGGNLYILLILTIGILMQFLLSGKKNVK